MRFALACFVGWALLLTGCSKTGGMPSKAAVQAVIEAHLRQKPSLMLTNMTLEVEDVKFSGETAVAQVKFRSKQSPDVVVGVRYVLRRTGDRWQVEPSSPSSGMGVPPQGGTSAPKPAPAPSEVPLQSSH